MRRIELYKNKFYKHQSLMQSALESFASKIVFSNDFDEEPVVCMAGDGELIAVWHKKECPDNDIIKCMLTKGYVEPRDFY